MHRSFPGIFVWQKTPRALFNSKNRSVCPPSTSKLLVWYLRSTWRTKMPLTHVYSIRDDHEHSHAKIWPRWNRLNVAVMQEDRAPAAAAAAAVLRRSAFYTESPGRPCCTCNVISRGVSSTPLHPLSACIWIFQQDLSSPSHVDARYSLLSAIRDSVSIISLVASWPKGKNVCSRKRRF